MFGDGFFKFWFIFVALFAVAFWSTVLYIIGSAVGVW